MVSSLEKQLMIANLKKKAIASRCKVRLYPCLSHTSSVRSLIPLLTMISCMFFELTESVLAVPRPPATELYHLPSRLSTLRLSSMRTNRMSLTRSEDTHLMVVLPGTSQIRTRRVRD